MSQTANVASLEALREFRVSLCSFGEDAREALVSVDMEIRRAVDWLHDQLKLWQNQVKAREHKVAEAKIVLNRKKISRVFGRHPDTTQEEEDLRKAVTRMREAEHKVERCRRWGPQLTHAIGEYEGPARQLGGQLDAELPKTLAALDRMLDALEQYVQLVAPSTSGAAGRSSATSEVTSAAVAGEELVVPTAPAGPVRVAKPHEPERVG
jgi:hypothetical protein